MYVLIPVIVLVVVLFIRLVIQPAMRRSGAASDLSMFQHHLANLQPPFTRNPGETVALSFVARDLGAVRSIVGESPTEDSFPGSFPLVFCTSQRLIVLMSTTDRPTAITGTYPARQPNLHHRIGEQFDGATSRIVSSASWRWETIGMVVAEDRSVGLSWQDREGAAVVLLAFIDVDEKNRFVDQAAALIEVCRRDASLSPAGAEIETEGDQTTFTFADPLVTCSSCDTTIVAVDRFCTGCGAPVTRMENA
jgi:hypothetical protein